jgi:dihydroxyacid dehydratase/phosphogluconate dehydratase
MLVDDDELQRRRAAWRAPVQPFERGWTRLYQQHVRQAHEGCDLDFLEGTSVTPEPGIF